MSFFKGRNSRSKVFSDVRKIEFAVLSIIMLYKTLAFKIIGEKILDIHPSQKNVSYTKKVAAEFVICQCRFYQPTMEISGFFFHSDFT